MVAADDARCSEIGASVLNDGGHAVDAAVAVALCGGVVNPMASGIGGGGFMVVRSADTSETLAFDFRETAPAASTQVSISFLSGGNNHINFLDLIAHKRINYFSVINLTILKVYYGRFHIV